MKRKGFTIVELMMVIGIISMLITITVSAISGSMKRAREQRAVALRTLVEQGIATYYAQNDKWPVDPGEVGNDSQQPEIYVFNESQVQDIIMELVKQTKQGHPVMDVSGLFVAKKGNSQTGMDFTSAVRGTKKNPRGIRLSEMQFGYPDKETGHFRKFKMTYSPATDKISVSQ